MPGRLTGYSAWSQAPTYDLPGQVQDCGVVVQDEVGVRGQDDAVQLEGQLVRIIAGGKLVLLKSGRGEAPDQRHELRLERGDPFPDRAGAGPHLQRRAGEEAAAREGAALQVIEERLAYRRQLSHAGGSRKSGLHDFFGEDPARLLHGGQLEFLLGPEVRVKAALAHADRRGQVPDRQALQPVDGSQRRGSAQDRAAGPFPVCTRARMLLAGELGLDPSPALRDLQARILRHDLAAAPWPARRRVPAAPAWLVTSTAFVGREGETAALLEAVGTHRLVTVTGTGGVGKTRLVAEALGSLTERLGLPATVAELTGATTGQADRALAAALGLGATGSVRAAVLEYLSISAGLLVLDNCEHVLGDTRALAEEILRRCPGIRVVATSRHRLGIAAEQVLPLAPLPVPDPEAPERAALTAAVRLFADRMRRVRPSFAVTPDALPVVADICRRLDGLPLALELAATRAATLGLGPLRSRLDDSLDLLGEEGRPRHYRLRAVVDWSYGLLGPADRRLLGALSVFGGDFDLEAAEYVADPFAVGSVALALARLVESSLVAASETGDGTAYRLLMIVRAYAAERLAGAGQEQMTRLAHAGWAASIVETVAREATGPGCAAALARVARNRADVGAAARWALHSGRPGLAGRITGALKLCPHWRPDPELIALIGEVARDPRDTAIIRRGAGPGRRRAGRLRHWRARGGRGPGHGGPEACRRPCRALAGHALPRHRDALPR